MGCGVKTQRAKMSCLRLLVGVFNFLLGLYSLVLLSCSVLVHLWLEHYLAMAQDLSYALPIFLLSLSLSTFCLSFLACCCVVRPAAPPPLGYLYSLCLGSLYLIQLITVMVSFIFRERVVEALKEGIYQSMELYGKETQSNQAVDFLQSKVGCCGVTDHSDWEHTVWGRGHPQASLPHSCCHSTTTGVCTPHHPGAQLYTQGCHTAIISFLNQHATHIISVLLLTTLLHGAAVISSFCLARTKSPYSHLA